MLISFDDKVVTMSLWNKIIFSGWLSLIFKPRDRFTRYFLIGLTSIYLINCVITSFQSMIQTLKTSKPTSANFSQIFTLYQVMLSTVTTMIHLRISELWLGFWMVKDFHTRFTCAYNVRTDSDNSVAHYDGWTEENLVFTGILIMTYLFSPVGLLVYFLACRTYFQRFAASTTIDWKNPQHLKLKKIVSAVNYQLIATRTIRFGDSLPPNARNLYRFVRGLVGLTIGLIIIACYACYVIYCILFHRTRKESIGMYPTWPPTSVRVHTVNSCWGSITTPIEKRHWRWKLESYWLQVCTFILFAPSGKNPLTLFRAMQHDFMLNQGKSNAPGFFPFGDGIAVSSHKYVKAYLQSRVPLIIKDFQTIGWSVSSSLMKFCDFNTIFLPNPRHPHSDQHLLSRKIVHQWLAAFPYQLSDSYLSRLVPRQPNSKPSNDAVYLAVGETLFFLATGGSLTADERDAYLDCVKNPFTFLPDWFNFMIAGNYMENKGYASYEKFQAAFARYEHGSALKAAFAAAEGRMSQTEVLRLIVCVFCLGAAPAPAKITANVIDRLWSDQTEEIRAGISNPTEEKMVDLFFENPRNFIKECARLNSILSMVSLLSNDQIAQDVKTYTGIDLPTNTRIHCSLMDANHDPNVFTLPNDFNPRRSPMQMGQIMTWNGAEEDIEKADEELRPPRYCPGHDLSLQVMEFVASRFAPVLTSHVNSSLQQIDDQDCQIIIYIRERNSRRSLDLKTNKHYFSNLDGYTRLIMKLSKMALQSWNTKPPRAIDIAEPSNLPTQELHLIRVEGARYVVTWDEDDRSCWRFHRKLVNKILNSKLWPFEDLALQFNSIDDMIAWRWKHFPSMPPPNNPHWYGDSDVLMSQFAFFGLACHHTRKLEPGLESMELHTATLKHSLLKKALYVNDMTALSLFAVRAPFDRYGAAAYFDSERRLIGIYLSHYDELIMPSSNSRSLDKDWIYAKYMWRSSALAMVTIRDHLLTTHFIEANTLTNVSRQYLPAHHPLRIFLKPFTYRTGTINYSAATSLVNEGGLCHRIWGFEYDEFIKLCDYVIAHYRFRILPDWISDTMKIKEHDYKNRQLEGEENLTQEYKQFEVNCSSSVVESGRNDEKLCEENGFEWSKHYPIAEDLPAFWKIVRDYVRRFFDIEYGRVGEQPFMTQPCERLFISELCKPLGLNGIPSRNYLIDVIAQLICACTGMHEHVGHVGDYLYDPSFIGTKLRRDLPSLLPSVQNYSLMLVLTVLTAMRMPGLMEDWSHLIPRVPSDTEKDERYSSITEEDTKSHLDNYHLFKNQLNELIEKIDERHRIPDNFPFQSFNPSYMECSVSV